MVGQRFLAATWNGMMLKANEAACVISSAKIVDPGCSDLTSPSPKLHRPNLLLPTPWVNAIMRLILDFDGTITEKDTIGELANAAIEFHKSRGNNELQAKWDSVVKSYVDDWLKYKDTYHIPEHERTSVDEELRFLRGLKESEEASLARIEASGVFANLEATDLFEMGVQAVKNGKVVIRKGFDRLVEQSQQQQWEMAVVSVNWSAAFIQGVLHPLEIRVISNEVASSGRVEGPEFLGREMTNSADKRECVEHLLGQDGRGAAKTVYFGDSTTDMECLLNGGVAISADDTCSLIKTLRRVGIEVPHVSDSQADISWARDFNEVLQSGILQTSHRSPGPTSNHSHP